MRLIDADRLLNILNDNQARYDNELKGTYYDGVGNGLEVAIVCVEHAPTVEARKRGHWFDPEDDDGRTAWHCSVCDYVVKTIGFYPNYNYCPCCGARMDKGVRK